MSPDSGLGLGRPGLGISQLCNLEGQASNLLKVASVDVYEGADYSEDRDSQNRQKHVLTQVRTSLSSAAALGGAQLPGLS